MGLLIRGISIIIFQKTQTASCSRIISYEHVCNTNQMILAALYMYMFCVKYESVQFRNRPAQSMNSHFVVQSGNSYLAQDNSRIVSAQSENRDKVRIIR